jgi:DNA-binding transcriptional LysR family regulator
MLAMTGIMKHNASVKSLDVTLLRTFVVAAEQSSMTAAGKILNLTQGAVSQQIARLESTFGCKLFVRDSRGLRLTAMGERLIGRARALLGLNDDIWTEMKGRIVEGRVRLGVPVDLIGTMLPPALRTFSERYPQVDLSLTSGSSPALVAALKRGELDIALAEEPIDQPEGECLAIDRLVWVGAQAGRAHTAIPLPISVVSETCTFRPMVLDALRRDGRRWRTVFENGSLEATVATVRADLAITASLMSTVAGDLTILDGNAGLPRLPAFAITLHLRPGDARPAASEFAAQLRSTFMDSRVRT